MEMVYLVNGGSGGGGGLSGYPLVKAVVTENAPAPEASGCPSDEVASPEGRKGPRAVGLQDRSVTRVELKTSDAMRINFHPKMDGVARDFLLRLVITADIQFSAGMNGVGMKAVNALSTFLTVRSVREGRYFQADFKAGVLALKNTRRCEESERGGTLVRYLPDAK